MERITIFIITIALLAIVFAVSTNIVRAGDWEPYPDVWRINPSVRCGFDDVVCVYLPLVVTNGGGQ